VSQPASFAEAFVAAGSRPAEAAPIDWQHTPLALLQARSARRHAQASLPRVVDALTDEYALAFGQNPPSGA
jgi:hypothetical protein